jgi:phosphoribosylformimino-5-aminoimidazole carboxamide ribotide isomerase
MDATTSSALAVERITDALSDDELSGLCEATVAAILDGGGFGWVDPPPVKTLAAYWRGVILVPERELFIARHDGIVCGSAQLVKPPRNNEAQKGGAGLQHAFVAPWARRTGLGTALIQAVERAAREERYRILNLDVRETQEPAIHIFRKLGFVHWGTHPEYARVKGRTVQGLFFFKDLGRKKKVE